MSLPASRFCYSHGRIEPVNFDKIPLHLKNASPWDLPYLFFDHHTRYMTYMFNSWLGLQGFFSKYPPYTFSYSRPNRKTQYTYIHSKDWVRIVDEAVKEMKNV